MRKTIKDSTLALILIPLALAWAAGLALANGHCYTYQLDHYGTVTGKTADHCPGKHCDYVIKYAGGNEREVGKSLYDSTHIGDVQRWQTTEVNCR